MHRRTVTISAVALAAALAACASEPQRPSAEMARAQTLIKEADKGNTQQYAAAELQQAHDKLNQAELASKDGRNAEAERLAMQAALDAEYATAKARNAEAQKSAEELDRSLESLRQESARKPTQ
ncbi:MAG TPA: DUF4398 domain-containing protein [Steroidobacteraceae bacterium]|jgi:hypothetical protein|nr:DUF4398 domain-containing protein [Steroidobacteraceae bacterium]